MFKKKVLKGTFRLERERERKHKEAGENPRDIISVIKQNQEMMGVKFSLFGGNEKRINCSRKNMKEYPTLNTQLKKCPSHLNNINT